MRNIPKIILIILILFLLCTLVLPQPQAVGLDSSSGDSRAVSPWPGRLIFAASTFSEACANKGGACAAALYLFQAVSAIFGLHFIYRGKIFIPQVPFQKHFLHHIRTTTEREGDA